MSNDVRILRYRDLTALGLGSRYTIYRKVLAGEFPKPVELWPGIIGWRESDVKDFLDSRPVHEIQK